MKIFHLNRWIHDGDIPLTIRQSPQGSIGPHKHDYVEIVIVRAGYGVQTIYSEDGSSQSSAFIKGDIFTVLPGEVHAYSVDSEFFVYNLCIGSDYLRKLSPDLPTLALYSDFLEKKRPFQISQFHLTPMKFANVEQITHQLIKNLLMHHPSRPLAVRASALSLLLAIFNNPGGEVKHTGVPFDEGLFSSIERMEEHAENSFNVQDAARMARMSGSSYAHKFKNAIGVSPANYHILIRLEHAQQQLLTTNHSLKEIAIENGFCDSTHFVLAFKKRFGVTPGQFRLQQYKTTHSHSHRS